MSGECRFIFWNLLTIIENEGEAASAPHYLREWKETERCNDFLKPELKAKFAEARERIRETTTEEAMIAIESFNEELSHSNRALQTMLHYKEWHRSLLLSTLSYTDYGYYTCWHKPAKFLSGIGIFSASFGGVKAATKEYRTLFNGCWNLKAAATKRTNEKS